MICRFRKMLSGTRESESGSVVILVALALFVLLVGAGVAVDMARAQILHTKVQSALDASGLYALKQIDDAPDGTDKATWAQQNAQRYFDANFPSGYLQTPAINIVANIVDANTIKLGLATTQTTTFMNMVGISSIAVTANSTVTRGLNGQIMEVVLVLDNTMSMNCDVNSNLSSCPSPVATAKILALKNAVPKLLDQLYGATNDTAPGVFVGVVPFSQGVNIGTQHVDWLTANGQNGSDIVNALDWGTNNQWYGCVEERGGMQDVTDDAPYSYSPNAFTPYYYPSEPTTDAAMGAALTAEYGYYWNWNPAPNPPVGTWEIPGWKDTDTFTTPGILGPNAFCPIPAQAMVASKSSVENEVSMMTATGQATLINEGLVWGWRMLSPKWRGLWGGDNNATEPQDYPVAGTTAVRKVVVLMTDGENQFFPYYYSAFGWLWNFFPGSTASADSEAQVSALLDTKTRAICDAMHADNVELYMIGFGNSSNVNVDLLTYCIGTESSDHLQIVTSDSDLGTVFQNIGQSLVNLRVSQ